MDAEFARSLGGSSAPGSGESECATHRPRAEHREPSIGVVARPDERLDECVYGIVDSPHGRTPLDGRRVLRCKKQGVFRGLMSEFRLAALSSSRTGFCLADSAP